MGVVWKAEDTSLEREARLLATLNHPNVSAVYGLHDAGGVRFIAMELVPGEELTERIARGPIPLEELIDTARQLAGGLEAAHEAGVIHRDLKPANVKLSPDGRVKILDLGLAKALTGPAGEGGPGDPAESPTMTGVRSLAGTILGTAGYMSPEQANGREVDRRTDIWAFGVLLYEMLTGRRLFDGGTISETIAVFSTSREIVSVPIRWEDGLPHPGRPNVLFRTRLRQDQEFDVTPDGQHILLNRVLTVYEEALRAAAELERGALAMTSLPGGRTGYSRVSAGSPRRW